MDIRVITAGEKLYLYSHNSLDSYYGCIGHLRGDFDTNGDGFFTTWFDHRGDLKTDAFKSEINDVVDSMRIKDGVLSNRNDMDRFCNKNVVALLDGSNESTFGFRTDTDAYSYLIRCQPKKGDYNFYLYCYKKEWMDRHIKKAEKGIRFIDGNYNTLFHIPDGEGIVITHQNGEEETRSCRFIDEYHTEINGSCYHICQFAEIMEQNGWTYAPENPILPERCYATLPTTGEVVIISKGEKGYHKLDIKGGQKFADRMNEKLRVSKAQEAAMLAGSMFGWDTPAADPKSYDVRGNPNPASVSEHKR